MAIHIYIPLLLPKVQGSSFQFHSSIEKVLMESGVCPVKRWGLCNCPQTSLYLLCKNYNGVTIFKAYFSINIKRHLFSLKWMLLSPCCPLIPCLLESCFVFYSSPLLDTFSFLLRSLHLYFGVFPM